MYKKMAVQQRKDILNSKAKEFLLKENFGFEKETIETSGCARIYHCIYIYISFQKEKLVIVSEDLD